MATPCVAGAVALLWDAIPQLSRKIPESLAVIYKTALPVRSDLCGSSGTPNNLFGHGVIDIHKAVIEGRKIYQNGNK